MLQFVAFSLDFFLFFHSFDELRDQLKENDEVPAYQVQNYF